MAINVTPGEGAVFKTTVEGDEHVGHTHVESLPITQPLTDAELRAEPVPVITGLTPLTDEELRDSPVPVSGPLTNTELRATPLPVSGTVTATVSGVATAANQASIVSGLGAIVGATEANYISDPATQTTLAAVLAKISADPATQTTLAAILAKIIAAPATEAKQDTLIAKDFATQTTLAAVLAKIIAAPATEAKQDSILAAINAQGPGTSFDAVTPANGSDLGGGACRAIMVVSDGNLAFRGSAEVSGFHTIPVVAGQMWPIRAIRIGEDTTATVLAVY